MNFLRKGADFNDESLTHRYGLYRIWNEDKPFALIIGLNPSTANHNVNDPTVRRITQLLNRSGYGGFYLVNLFSLVSSNPKTLIGYNHDFGFIDDFIDWYSQDCKTVIFAWGAFKEAKDRAKFIIDKYPNALCFGHNKDSSPKHPLYLKGNTNLINFKNESSNQSPNSQPFEEN